MTVLSSRGNDYTRKVGPAVVEAVAALTAKNAYLDGELVVEGEDGITDFGLLQDDLGNRTDRLRVYLFDIMFLEGRDLKAMPLIERKARLAQLLRDAPPSSPLRLSQVYEEPDGDAMHEHACKLGIEGVVSKVRDSRYIPGDKGGAVWHKAICNQVAPFLICGYIPDKAGAIDSLYFGEREGTNIHYRGHVTVNPQTSKALKPAIAKAEQPRNPFADKSTHELKPRGVRFVKPTRFVEVSFRGTTENGRLRHPSFVGLRK